MPTIRQIRRRIRSVQNTAKITHAMELVAASKMRRAQVNALADRPYAERLRWVLANLAENLPLQNQEDWHPLLRRQEGDRTAVVLMTPDRGLCGGLNANLNRQAAAFALAERDQGREVSWVSMGRKGRDFLRRVGQTIQAEFPRAGDYPSYEDMRPIARVVTDGYVSGEMDRVYLLFPLFVNTVSQRPEVRQLLPVEPPQDRSTWAVDYIYEPSREAVLDDLLPRFVELEVYQAALELAASEQSARMVAMRNATDNASDMVDDLTLTYNKVRQEQITRELLDLTAGAAVLRA